MAPPPSPPKGLRPPQPDRSSERRNGRSGREHRPIQPSREAEITQLAKDVELLRLDFERFFNGALPLPPEGLRTRIDAQFRQLRNVQNLGSVDRFRLGNLEARYQTLSEILNRRLREREEGRRKRHASGEHVVAHDPRQGVTLDRQLDAGAVEALYQGLVRAGNNTRFDLDSFTNYLGSQLDAIRQKTGCERVQFRLADEDGKIKLKAKPLATEATVAGADPARGDSP